ncbi:MAG: FAD-dependent oxidoreductase [Lachnospiraceae bacterium]|nr:FAD-dependent oxidoreductase [Lachnospiraceae bacterium]
MKDMIIIGAGPAGLSAAVYGLRAGLDLEILESSYMGGGQVLNTYEVDNYLGLPHSNGFDMGMTFQKHVADMGKEPVSCEVTGIEKRDGVFRITTDQGMMESKTLILASGAVNRKLEVPGEEELKGKGVSYCATCDGALYRGQTVAVVGGSYTAVEDAIYLAGLCEKVYLIHRRDSLRAGAVLEERLRALVNVEILWNTLPAEILGKDEVERFRVRNKLSGEECLLDVQGVFVAVGTVPNTLLVRGLVEMDEYGYIVAGEDCATSVPGLFAAGDLRTKKLRQIITAVADGANAATSAWEYLQG